MSPLSGRIVGIYDWPVVVLSVGIAVLASYSAFDLAERVNAARGIFRHLWIISGSVVLGIGIWSMHYTGMLAFRLPVSVLYHWPTALCALLVGVIASIVSLLVVCRERIAMPALLAASVFQGGGIATLHYTAMASMRLPAICHYSPTLVVISILVAVGGALLSFRLMFLFRYKPSGWMVRRLGSALLMGASISAMHYTGMAAASFAAVSGMPPMSHSVRVTALSAAGIIAVPAIVLVGTVVTALIDRLRETSTILTTLFEQSPQSVAVMNADGRILRANAEFTRTFGYEPHEIAGRPLKELIDPGDLEQEFKACAEWMPEGNRVDAETVRQRKDGSRIQVLVTSLRVDLPGKESQVWAIYRDITARKKTEVALQALSGRLLEVQENERRHLAGELHDEIGQLLTGLRLLLKTDGEASAQAIMNRFDQARTIVDGLLASVRRLSFDLRPADLDQLGLLAALLGLFERYTAQTGILVDFKHRGLDRRFAPQVETAVYRVLQEALTNTARHAGVAGVSVRVWTEANGLSLRVEDQGSGFDPDEVMRIPQSSGLIGMSERVSLLNGRLIIESSPGSGTTITAEFPLRT